MLSSHFDSQKEYSFEELCAIISTSEFISLAPLNSQANRDVVKSFTEKLVLSASKPNTKMQEATKNVLDKISSFNQNQQEYSLAIKQFALQLMRSFSKNNEEELNPFIADIINDLSALIISSQQNEKIDLDKYNHLIAKLTDALYYGAIRHGAGSLNRKIPETIESLCLNLFNPEHVSKKDKIQQYKESVSALANTLIKYISSINPFRLEAIAYLTGYIYPELPSGFHRNFSKENFLSDTNPILFENFNKHILILQLVARIIKPELIDQSDQQICGVAALMHALVTDEPLCYARCVAELATKNEVTFKIHPNATGIKMHMPANSDIYQRKSRQSLLSEARDKINPDEPGPIDMADFIALVLFRLSQNRSKSTWRINANIISKSIFGVSFSFEIEKWMKDIGYNSVRKIKINTPDDIKTLKRFIHDGCACVFQTTSDLTRKAFVEDDEHTESKIALLFRGHFIQLKDIDYDEHAKTVKLSLISWGEKREDIVIPYDIFAKIKGFSNAIVGITNGRIAQLKSRANRNSKLNLKRLHPFTYLNHVKSLFMTAEWPTRSTDLSVHLPPNAPKNIPYFLAEIIKMILFGLDHTYSASWMKTAQNVQNAIDNISYKDIGHLDEKTILIFKSIKQQCLDITLINSSHATDLVIESSLMADKAEKFLKQAIDMYQDPEAVRELMEFFFSTNQGDKAKGVFKRACAWLSTYEIKRCEGIFIQQQLEEAHAHINMGIKIKKYHDILNNKNSTISLFKLSAIKELIKIYLGANDKHSFNLLLQTEFAQEFKDHINAFIEIWDKEWAVDLILLYLDSPNKEAMGEKIQKLVGPENIENLFYYVAIIHPELNRVKLIKSKNTLLMPNISTNLAAIDTCLQHFKNAIDLIHKNNKNDAAYKTLYQQYIELNDARNDIVEKFSDKKRNHIDIHREAIRLINKIHSQQMSVFGSFQFSLSDSTKNSFVQIMKTLMHSADNQALCSNLDKLEAFLTTNESSFKDHLSTKYALSRHHLLASSDDKASAAVNNYNSSNRPKK